ncbi:MAG: ATP-binding protein [Dehalococcoidia bacterium]|nr:ATP-binding protein [Dehalococcoidia bacterium]
MNTVPDGVRLQQDSRQLKAAEWLLNAKSTTGIRSPHFWIISLLMAGLGYVYYGVLPAFHDVYIILFFYPLLYAAIVFCLKGVTVTWVVFLGLLLPHVFLFSSDPYSLARSLLFAAFAFLISGLFAAQLNYLQSQVESCSEIVALNEELTDSIQRLENTQNQLVQSVKLNALGHLAASIAHEINNPLSGALLYTKLVSKKVGSDSFDKGEAVANLSKIESAISHCCNLVRGLLDFARQSAPNLRPVATTEILNNTLALVGHEAQMKRIQVVRDELPSLPPVMADPDQIQQVLLNLTINAIQAMSEGGKLTLRTSIEENGMVAISVQDTGCGIPPENLERLFTPFFTTKEKGRGVGLGLAVSYGIVERHGGKIEVQSEVGKGSTFTVRLPAVKEAMQPG